jgi:protoporphyrinogen oxidase
MENRKVIIVGAGIGGLAAAHWLGRRGYEVEILEASDRPGGRMVTLERRGDRVNVGAQFFHTDFRYAYQLIKAVGLGGSRRPISGCTEYTLCDGSRHLFNPKSPYMKLLGLRGNLELYRFVLRHVLFGKGTRSYQVPREIPDSDDVEVLSICDSPADRTMRDYLVTTLAFGMTGAEPEWTSLYHFIRLFRSTIFASYFELTRGVSSLAEALAERLPVEYEAPVRRLVVEKDRVVGVQMEGDGSVRKAGHVIVAVTPPAAAVLLPEELEEQRSFFRSVRYTPAAMPVFFLDRPLRRDVWCYLNDPAGERTFKFALDAHARCPEMCPSGKAALTGWAVYPTALALMEQSDEEILQKATEDVEWMIPGFSGWIEEAAVVRHPFVNALYPPGSYQRIVEFQERAERLRGVSFSSSVLRGTSMEAAMASAAGAVRRVCAWGGTA